MHGKAEFLSQLMAIEPFNARPPLITNLSTLAQSRIKPAKVKGTGLWLAQGKRRDKSDGLPRRIDPLFLASD